MHYVRNTTTKCDKMNKFALPDANTMQLWIYEDGPLEHINAMELHDVVMLKPETYLQVR